LLDLKYGMPHVWTIAMLTPAWIASSRAPTPLDVIVETLFNPSVKPEESTSKAELELMIIDEPAQ
jgi:hypothetical protein